MSPRHLHKNTLRLRTGEPVLPAALGLLLTFPFEPAVDAVLSGPPVALDKRVCNDYSVDANGGNHMHAKAHTEGFNADGPDLAANPRRKHPLGLCMRDDGTVRVLDAGNNCIRRGIANGVSIPAKKFTELGTFCTETDGWRSVFDRGGKSIPQVTMSENWTSFAGNGTARDHAYFYSAAELRSRACCCVTPDANGNIPACACERDDGFSRCRRYERMISDH